jgi:hypothetical protein
VRVGNDSKLIPIEEGGRRLLRGHGRRVKANIVAILDFLALLIEQGFLCSFES